tara:strand:+ start:14642 stop:16873 length:2232 start_codon:yes stop_codon:yes gene_type:complete
MSLMTLVACGGGDGGLSREDGGGDGTTGDIITVTLAISNVNVTEQSPATITATVIEGSTAKEGIVVTFSTTLGNFTPEAGTALTNSNGVASLVLNSGDVSGAGIVTATVSTGEEGVIGFTTEAASSSIVVRLGNGQGVDFTESVANVSLEKISAGGTTVVSVSLVDEQGELYSETVVVNFTSRCTEGGTATLSPVVTTSNGLATSTYLAKGCIGEDTIQVNATVGGINLSAAALINVLKAEEGSIIFESVSTKHIAIQGTGSIIRPESSIVVFQVLDTNGNPINGKNVSFTLSSTSGGITLDPSTATTNSEGLVQTVVNSGAVSRTVSVIAIIDETDPIISTSSSELIISTGIPDQDSFSLSASSFNPEAWQYDGVEVIITARLADAFNNPPLPTVVFFTTEGGSIGHLSADRQCTTGDDGSCFVTWRSQSPKPAGKELFAEEKTPRITNIDLNGEPNFMGQKYGGRATILATTIGEESFPDLNGNGRFDECEVAAFLGTKGKPCNKDGGINSSGVEITYSGNDIAGNPYDLREAFVDHNEDDYFNPNPVKEDPKTCGIDQNKSCMESGGEQEEPSDFNENGLFDDKDNLYNGVLCAIPAHSGCSATQKSLDVRAQLVLVMSGSGAQFIATKPTPLGNVEGTLTIKGEGTASASVIIADLHNQPMPSGTTVKFEVAGFGSVTGPNEFTWSDTNKNGGSEFSVIVKGEKEDLPKEGSLIVTVTTPNGNESAYTVAKISITAPTP